MPDPFAAIVDSAVGAEEDPFLKIVPATPADPFEKIVPQTPPVEESDSTWWGRMKQAWIEEGARAVTADLIEEERKQREGAFPAEKLLPVVGVGPPGIRMAPEEWEAYKAGLAKPLLPESLKLPVKKDEPLSSAIPKAIINVAAGPVEFAFSPAGVAALGAGAVAPTVVAGAFLIDTAKGLIEQGSELWNNWDILSPAEKAEGVVNEVGMGVLASLLGFGVKKGVTRNIEEFKARARQKLLAGMQAPGVQTPLPAASAQVKAGATVPGTIVPVAPLPGYAFARPEPKPVSPVLAPDPTPPLEVIAEGKVADLAYLGERVEPKEPNATPEGKLTEGGLPEHPGVPQGENVPANTGEVRGAEGEQAGNRGGPVGGAEVSGDAAKGRVAPGISAVEAEAGLRTPPEPTAEPTLVDKAIGEGKAQTALERDPQATEGPIRVEDLPQKIGTDALGRPFEYRGENVKTKRVNVTSMMDELTRRHTSEKQQLRRENKRGPEEGLIEYARRIDSMVAWTREDASLVKEIIAGLRVNLEASKLDAANERSKVTKRTIELTAEDIEKGWIPRYEDKLKEIEAAVTSKEAQTIPQRDALLREGLSPAQADGLLEGTTTVERVVQDNLERLEQSAEARPDSLEHGKFMAEAEQQATSKLHSILGTVPPASQAESIARNNAAQAKRNAAYIATAKAKGAVPGATPLNPPPGPTTGPTTLQAGPLNPGAITRGIQRIIQDINDSEWFRRYFTKERGLDPESYAAWRVREGFVNEHAARARFASADLVRALKEHAGVRTDIGLVWWARKNQGVLNDINLVLRDQAPITALPVALQDAAWALRLHVDFLSNYMIHRGLVPNHLAAIFGQHLGSYLTRSYRVFEDPHYDFGDVPLQLKNRAEAFLQFGAGMSPTEAQLHLARMFGEMKANGADQVWKAGKLGGKDISIIMQRKDIAPEIRAVMGEYTDPFVNYNRTIAKAARLAGDQEFLNVVRSVGLGKWLFERGRGTPEFNTPISAEGSRTMSPLNGLYTSPMMARVFQEWNVMPPETGWRYYYMLNAASKMSKTVYSVMTHSRNAFGQFVFWLQSGHYDLRKIKDATQALFADIGVRRDDAWRERYEKYVKLGVVGEGVMAGELRSSLTDFSRTFADPNGSPLEYSMRQNLKGVFVDAPEKLYRVTDEVGKVVGFENEVARLRRDNPTLPIQEIEARAAERIRNTYPTYSNISEAFQKLRRVPFVGPFMSFAYESFRTSIHSLRYVAEDARAGHARSAIERGAGTFAAIGGVTYGLQAFSKWLAGMTPQDERDVRRNLPDWEKNSTFIFTKQDDGKVNRINTSYVNPYSYMLDPLITALTRSPEETEDAWVRAITEFLRPWTSEQMLFGALDEVRNNKDHDTGRQIYNPEDPNKTAVILKYVWENALEPGTLTRYRKRMLPAMRGELQAQGTLRSELIAEATGFRTVPMDFAEQVKWKAGDARKRLDDARHLFTTGIGSKTPSGDLLEKYKLADNARFEAFQSLFQDIQAARRQGVEDDVIKKQLKAGGITKTDLNRVMEGVYSPYHPGKELDAIAEEAGKVIPREEIGEILSRRGGQRLEEETENPTRGILPGLGPTTAPRKL